MLREQTGRRVRFSADAGALAQAEESHTAIARGPVDTAELLTALKGGVRRPLRRQGGCPAHRSRRYRADLGRPATAHPGTGQSARQRPAAHPAGGHVTLTTTRRGPGSGLHCDRRRRRDPRRAPAARLRTVLPRRLRPRPRSRRIGYRTSDRQGTDRSPWRAHQRGQPRTRQGTTFTVAVPVASQREGVPTSS